MHVVIHIIVLKTIFVIQRRYWCTISVFFCLFFFFREKKYIYCGAYISTTGNKYLPLTPEIKSFSIFFLFSHEKRPNQNVKHNSLLQLSAFPLSL